MVVGHVDDLSAMAPCLFFSPRNITGFAWSELKVIFYLAVLLALSHTLLPMCKCVPYNKHPCVLVAH